MSFTSGMVCQKACFPFGHEHGIGRIQEADWRQRLAPRHVRTCRCTIGEPPSFLEGKAWESHQPPRESGHRALGYYPDSDPMFAMLA